RYDHSRATVARLFRDSYFLESQAFCVPSLDDVYQTLSGDRSDETLKSLVLFWCLVDAEWFNWMQSGPGSGTTAVVQRAERVERHAGRSQ
ncbi:MAG: hypothetical protein ACK55O_03695, partial [Phycisphaerales bacterium]